MLRSLPIWLNLPAALVLLLSAVGSAHAFPTSGNIIPTADMLEQGACRLEVENDGAPRLFAAGDENYLLLQFAPHPRLELGVDLYSASDDNQLLLNAKWLAVGEARRRPALALGVMEVGHDYQETGYLVATKDLGGGFRMSLGGAACGADEALLLGAELQVGERDYLLADWASWSAGYVSFGLYREFGEGFGINLAYAWPNEHAEDKLFLLNLSRTFSYR